MKSAIVESLTTVVVPLSSHDSIANMPCAEPSCCTKFLIERSRGIIRLGGVVPSSTTHSRWARGAGEKDGDVILQSASHRGWVRRVTK